NRAKATSNQFMTVLQTSIRQGGPGSSLFVGGLERAGSVEVSGQEEGPRSCVRIPVVWLDRSETGPKRRLGNRSCLVVLNRPMFLVGARHRPRKAVFFFGSRLTLP